MRIPNFCCIFAPEIGKLYNNMATAIRNIPTLFGAEADSFLKAAEATENNPGMIDFSHQNKTFTEYFRNNPLW